MPTSEHDAVERLGAAEVPAMRVDADAILADGRRRAVRRRAVGLGAAACGLVIAGAGFLFLRPDGPLGAPDPVEPAAPSATAQPSPGETATADIPYLVGADSQGGNQAATVIRRGEELSVQFIGPDGPGEELTSDSEVFGVEVFRGEDDMLVMWPMEYDATGYPVVDPADLPPGLAGVSLLTGAQLTVGEESLGWAYQRGDASTPVRDVAVRSREGEISFVSGALIETTEVQVEDTTVQLALAPDAEVLGICPAQEPCTFGRWNNAVVSGLSQGARPEDLRMFVLAAVPEGAIDVEAALVTPQNEIAGDVSQVDLAGSSLVLGVFPNTEEVGTLIGAPDTEYVVSWTDASGSPNEVRLDLA